MIALVLSLGLARAAPAGHYHPLDVAAASARFGEAQAVAGTTFEARQAEARALAAALVRYEEALDLLGERAPADDRTRQVELRRAFQRQQRTLEAFAQLQLDGFDQAFSAALERALGGREATVCRVEPRGLRMGPFATRSDATCEGSALNAELADRMDDDPRLAAQISALVEAAWPTFSLPVEARAPVGDGERHVDVVAWMRAGAAPALDAVEAADADARTAFEAAVEEGASDEALALLLEEARAVTDRTAAWRAALAAPVLAATEAAALKAARKGAPTIAWCAQPELLGGCAGEALAADAAEALRAAAPVRRALERAAAWRP